MAGGLWFVGLCLGILASMSGTTGKQLLRFSELQRRKGTVMGRYMSKVTLVLGLAFNTAIGPLIDMSSYAFAPQSLIAPLGALDVVWNTATAPCTLGETLTPRLALGCMMVFGCAVTTSLVGNRNDRSFTVESIQEVLIRPTVGIYMLALGAWLAFNMAVLIPRSKNPKGEPWETGDHLRGLSLGMTAGSIAGNMFCVKAFVELLAASFAGHAAEIWSSWLPYVLLIGAIFFATSNLYFLTRAMREYEALFMGAVFEGSLITSACVSGCVVFSELQTLRPWQIGIYWTAIAGMMAGIAIVSMEAQRRAKEKERAEKLQRSAEHVDHGELSSEAPDPVAASDHEGDPEWGNEQVHSVEPGKEGALLEPAQGIPELPRSSSQRLNSLSELQDGHASAGLVIVELDLFEPLEHSESLSV